jgi:hypothetical protein
MLISRKSPFSGKVNSMDLPITESQLERWQAGEMIQNVFPRLTADEREFLMTGITAQEWEDTFKEVEE